MSLSRKEKEKLYNRKMIELQRMWENPVDPNWEFDFEDATDQQVDKLLADVVGQLRYEKSTRFMANSITFVVKAFVFLGIVGLLLFGIRQLFSLG